MILDSKQGENLGILILKGLGLQDTSSMAIPSTTTDSSREFGFVANTTALGPAEVFRGDANRQSGVLSLRTLMIIIGFCVLTGVEI